MQIVLKFLVLPHIWRSLSPKAFSTNLEYKLSDSVQIQINSTAGIFGAAFIKRKLSNMNGKRTIIKETFKSLDMNLDSKEVNVKDNKEGDNL